MGVRVMELKSHPQWFQLMARADRWEDIRDNTDREFEVGDLLIYREWTPVEEKYTGNELARVIESITPAKEMPDNVLRPGVVLMRLNQFLLERKTEAEIAEWTAAIQALRDKRGKAKAA